MQIDINMFLPNQYPSTIPGNDLRRYIGLLAETTGYTTDTTIILTCDIHDSNSDADDITTLHTIADIFNNMVYERDALVTQSERGQRRLRSIRKEPVKILAVRCDNKNSSIYSKFSTTPKGFVQYGNLPRSNWMLFLDKTSVDFIKSDILSRQYPQRDVDMGIAMGDFITNAKEKEEWHETMLWATEDSTEVDNLGEPLVIIDNTASAEVLLIEKTLTEEYSSIVDSSKVKIHPTVLSIFMDECSDQSVANVVSHFITGVTHTNLSKSIDAVVVCHNNEKAFNTAVLDVVSSVYKLGHANGNVYVNRSLLKNADNTQTETNHSDSLDSRAKTNLFD